MLYAGLNRTTENHMTAAHRFFRASTCRVGLAVALLLVTAIVGNAFTPERNEDSSFFPADVTTSFGRAVAVYGDTAVVGDPDNDLNGSDAGAAWIYVRSGSTWVEQVRLSPSDASVNDHFGESVDIYDKYIVVGAPWAEGAGAMNSGAAYVFRRDGPTWTEQAKLVGAETVVGDPWDGPSSGDQFGHSVAINGDIPADSTNNEIWHNIVVGSPGDNHSQEADAGSAYGFQLSADGTAWIPMIGKFYSNDPFYADEFGVSVDLDGDHMIIGAHKDENSLSIGNCGAAYIWVRRNMDGMWGLERRITASDPGVHDHFGISVAVNAIGGLATFVVGAEGDDELGYDYGSVYVFVGSASTFPQMAKLVASDAGNYAEFGTSVAANNDLVVVGAAGNGSAYVFERQGASWVESQRLLAVNGTWSDLLGTSVAVTGDTALAGAPDADSANSDGGAVFVFDDLLDDEIFSDGFESGGVNRWTSSTP